MNNINEIPIFFTIDDNYIPFLAVTLQSLVDNYSTQNLYKIIVLYKKNITEENKNRIYKYKRENLNIEFVDLESKLGEIENKLYTRDYYSKSTYYRLLIPELYPEYDKALYLDSDIVILTDIANLYNVDLEGNLIGAAPDEAIANVKAFQEYAEKVVGVESYSKYFNAGVLVMNLKGLRETKFQDKFLYLLETVKYTVAQDQDYLNRICKGKVKILDGAWDKMPIGGKILKEEELKLLHFNLISKPWLFEGIAYEEYFWKYAEKTEFIEDIKKIKDNYSEEQKVKDMQAGDNLIATAQKEADCVGNDRVKKEDKAQIHEKAKDRLAVLRKIEELERQGKFDIDVEDDPPTIPLKPENVDYLNKKSMSKVKTIVANKVGEKFLNDLIKNNKLIIKEIKGIENMQNVQSGAMVTCNHFNPYDCFTIEKVFRISGQEKNRKLHKVIREGNYTNFPGLYGFFFRNCNTLPLSSNKRTMVEFMKAVDKLLQKGDFILIYPEQSMWWNYRKPKPLKHGAFKLAARSKVPVIPIFITMQDSNMIGEDGFPIQEYIVNIEKPIYPDENATERENTDNMLLKNYEIWKKVYEDFYKIPLEYKTENKE
ncbi:MAG: 1-acyl-sn-glycerol-3-phosphate acyltransferase [Clostridia bacterium]|nr:1-acyl-sn-glycerol-3-phosphate acyltransferase [Clostridia bacterium]